MTDQDKELRRLAEAAKGWGNCNNVITNYDAYGNALYHVGHIDEDGEEYPVITVDCDLYDAGMDSVPLAKFYAAANPATILSLLDQLEAAERDAARYRWLRRQNDGLCLRNWVVFAPNPEHIELLPTEKGRLDELIDSAMNKEDES